MSVEDQDTDLPEASRDESQDLSLTRTASTCSKGSLSQPRPPSPVPGSRSAELSTPKVSPETPKTPKKKAFKKLKTAGQVATLAHPPAVAHSPSSAATRKPQSLGARISTAPPTLVYQEDRTSSKASSSRSPRPGSIGVSVSDDGPRTPSSSSNLAPPIIVDTVCELDSEAISRDAQIREQPAADVEVLSQQLHALQKEHEALKLTYEEVVHRNEELSVQITRTTSSADSLPEVKGKGPAHKPVPPEPHHPHEVRPLHKQAIEKIMKSKAWKVVAVVSLSIALFGSSIIVLLDVQDDPGNTIVDIIMVSIMLFFMVELVFTWQIRPSYRNSFFFWMDVAGTISMVFEMSFFAEEMAVSTVVLRAARSAKIGARIGRVFKMQKILMMRKNGDQAPSHAKVLSSKLMLTLSTKVSILTLVLVMAIPLFSIPMYPREDLSMDLWSQRLEEVYRWELEAKPTNMFESSLLHMESFYSTVANYQPYKIEGYHSELSVAGVQKGIEGQHQLQGKQEPNRKANKREAEVATCRLDRTGCNGAARAKVLFDFTTPNRIEAGMAIILVFFMIVVMITMSYQLHRAIEALLVTPLERMLGSVRVHAATLLHQVAQLHDDEEDGEHHHHHRGHHPFDEDANEVEVLEIILKKLARLVELQLQQNVVQKSELGNMSEEKLAVLQMMDVKVVDTAGRRSIKPLERAHMMKQCRIMYHTSTEQAVDEELGSWHVDVLTMTPEHVRRVVTHMFYQSAVGSGDDFAEHTKFDNFLSLVEAGYNDVPYHRYAHAVDILHCVFRFLSLIRCFEWMSPFELHAMLVAALCHDLGHFGKTNAFLVETGHELALQYNDISPLENMHCAKLFQICRDPEADVFGKSTAQARGGMRDLCITAILHTDNAKHFQVVKDLSQCYEMHSDICDDQAEDRMLTTDYLHDVLHTHKHLWFELFLHLADVSNPAKPFEICYPWALRVLDEFFLQGDEEKRLSITVGMLNDREKVNRPCSQHGFINFLVAPLVSNSVRIFPQLQQIYTQLASNMESWLTEWTKESRDLQVEPPQDELQRKKSDVEALKDDAEKLLRRSGEEDQRGIFSTTLNKFKKSSHGGSSSISSGSVTSLRQKS